MRQLPRLQPASGQATARTTATTCQLIKLYAKESTGQLRGGEAKWETQRCRRRQRHSWAIRREARLQKDRQRQRKQHK